MLLFLYYHYIIHFANGSRFPAKYPTSRVRVPRERKALHVVSGTGFRLRERTLHFKGTILLLYTQ